MAATKLGVGTQPDSTYLSEVPLTQGPVILAQNSDGTTDTGSSALVTITPSVPSSKFNLPWDQPEPIATTHTVQAGSTASAIIVSPAISFPAVIGSADYTGKGFTCFFPADNPFAGRGASIIASNTGTTQINLASPLGSAPTVGETIEVHSGFEFSALSAVCASGVATFPTFSISGNASTALVAASSGLTGVTTNAIANAGTYYRGAELPRFTHDTTYPTVIGAQYTVQPGNPITGTNFHTVQAAYNAAVTANLSTAIELLIDPGTYAEHITLKPKTNPGEIIFRRAGSHVVPAGTRVKPSDFASGGVKISVEDSRAVVQCQAGACYVRFCGIEICQPIPAGGTATDLIAVLFWQMLDSDDNTVLANYPHHLIADRCYIHGGTGIELRKGITFGGPYQSVVDSDIRDIFNLKAAAGGVHLNGDTNAIGASYSPGPHKIDNSHLNAAGEIVLFGGADPPIKGMVPSDVSVTRCYVEKPLSWKGVYQAKNTFEYKNVRRLLIDGCVFDGSWEDAQDGTGMLLNTANQSQSPSNGFEGVRDVVLRNSFLRNMTAAFTLIGENYNYGYLQRRIVLEHLAGVNIRWNEPSAPGAINRLFYLGKSLADVVIDHATILGSLGVGVDALYLESPASARSDVTNCILTCSSLGVFSTSGLAGSAALAAYLPDATFAKNLLLDRNFGDGVTYPASSYYPPTNADVGFTDLSQINSFDTMDPDAVCAALALAGGPYRAGQATPATDGTDIGADMTAVRSSVLGVVEGTPGTGSTADHLAMSVQPSGAVSGVALTTQPSIVVQDNTNSTVTGDTSTVTASWVSLTGDASPSGTLNKSAVAGVATFTNLALTWTVPSTGYWHFTDGSLTSVNATTQTLTVTQTATHLAIQTQPGNGVSGVALPQQPVVRVADAGNATVTADTRTVLIALNTLTGSGELTGVVGIGATAGVASFIGVVVTGVGTFTLTITDQTGNLPAITSASFAVTDPNAPDFGITPGAPAVYRMARGKAVFGGFRRMVRAFWRWLTLSHSLA